MSNVLFSWELGTNSGHLAQQLLVARELRCRGHRILFAVCDLEIAHAILAAEAFDVVQAPTSRRGSSGDPECEVYAEILAGAGFGCIGTLRAIVAGWDGLFTAFKPDVVVVVHAPLAGFAARLSQRPVVHLALGFELPVFAETLPVLRPWKNPGLEKAKHLESELLTHASTVAREHFQPGLTNILDIYDSDASLLATFPELDHFPQRRNGRYIGPLLIQGEGQRARWTDRPGPKGFLYLRSHAGLEWILESLLSEGLQLIAVIPNVPDDIKERYSSETVQIFTDPVNLKNILNDADVAISYGGHGLVACCLMAGVPMLLIPTNIEQLLCAQRVESIGAGLAMGLRDVEKRFADACRSLLGEPKFEEAAKRFARKYAMHDQVKVIQRLANTVERLHHRPKGDLKSEARMTSNDLASGRIEALG